MGRFVFVLYTLFWFYIGRMSVLVVKNSYLEAKRKELDAYRNALVVMGESIQEEQKAIRKKWQSMVVDISKYEFANKSDDGVWTNLDDMYFRSWNSAEQ